MNQKKVSRKTSTSTPNSVAPESLAPDPTGGTGAPTSSAEGEAPGLAPICCAPTARDAAPEEPLDQAPSTYRPESEPPGSSSARSTDAAYPAVPLVRQPAYAAAEALVLRPGDHGTYDPPGILEDPTEATLRDLIYLLAYDARVAGDIATMTLAGLSDELEVLRFAMDSRADDASLEYVFRLTERQLRRITQRVQVLVLLQQRIDRADRAAGRATS